MPNKRLLISITAVILSLILVATASACGGSPQTKPSINLALANYFNSWLSTYAIREHIVDSSKVDVNITLAADYETQIIAGKFPMGAMATATFAIAREANNLHYKGISTFIVHEGAVKQEGVNVLFASANSSINSPADLVGKKVGVPDLTSSATSVFLGLLKKEYGISEDQLTLVNKQNPLLLELLRQGEIDVAMLGGNVSVQAYVDPAFKVIWNLDKTFYAENGDYFFPSILVVSESYYDSNPDTVKAVYSLLQESNQYGERHLSELAGKYAAEYGQTADFYQLVFNEHSRTVMETIDGKTQDTLMAIFSLVKERGIISSMPDPGEIFIKW
jgi:ABC-type nitrate/sulfonate/bicarbonate transport system substrate-binding protein